LFSLWNKGIYRFTFACEKVKHDISTIFAFVTFLFFGQLIIIPSGKGVLAMKQFEEIYQSYFLDVFRFLNKLSHNAILSEELAQETFYCAYLGIAKFKGQCAIKTWLMQIAKNRFFLYQRKNKKMTISFDEICSELFDDQSSSSPLSRMIEKQTINSALNVINQMGSAMKDVFIYRIFTDLPYKQIAQLLGISESSAKVLFHRGKLFLRKKLSEEHGYEI